MGIRGDLMDWDELNHLQLGKYAEYLVKLQFLKHGLDTYTAEVDDKGIDLVIRKNADQYYDIQVKSIRGLNYIFLSKEKFELRKNLYAAIVLFGTAGSEPSFYLIPSLDWKTPNALLRDYEYSDRKSKPEYGLNISKKNLPLLEQYIFEKVVQSL